MRPIALLALLALIVANASAQNDTEVPCSEELGDYVDENGECFLRRSGIAHEDLAEQLPTFRFDSNGNIITEKDYEFGQQLREIALKYGLEAALDAYRTASEEQEMDEQKRRKRQSGDNMVDYREYAADLVPDQGGCGSCYVFAAIRAIEMWNNRLTEYETGTNPKMSLDVKRWVHCGRAGMFNSLLQPVRVSFRMSEGKGFRGPMLDRREQAIKVVRESLGSAASDYNGLNNDLIAAGGIGGVLFDDKGDITDQATADALWYVVTFAQYPFPLSDPSDSIGRHPDVESARLNDAEYASSFTGAEYPKEGASGVDIDGACNGGIPSMAITFVHDEQERRRLYGEQSVTLNENDCSDCRGPDASGLFNSLSFGSCSANSNSWNEGTKAKALMSSISIYGDANSANAQAAYVFSGSPRSEKWLELIRNVLDIGPVTASISTCDEFKKTDGVTPISHIDCDNPSPSGTHGRHAVVLTGYKYDPADPDNSYWMFANSWGSGYGENGFGRIRMGSCYLNRISLPSMRPSNEPLNPFFPPASLDTFYLKPEDVRDPAVSRCRNNLPCTGVRIPSRNPLTYGHWPRQFMAMSSLLIRMEQEVVSKRVGVRVHILSERGNYTSGIGYYQANTTMDKEGAPRDPNLPFSFTTALVNYSVPLTGAPLASDWLGVDIELVVLDEAGEQPISAEEAAEVDYDGALFIEGGFFMPNWTATNEFMGQNKNTDPPLTQPWYVTFGIVVGVVAGACLIVGLAWTCLHRKSKEAPVPQYSSSRRRSTRSSGANSQSYRASSRRVSTRV